MKRIITRHHCVHCGLFCAASHDNTGVLRFHRHSQPDSKGAYCEGSGGQPATEELIESTRALGRAFMAQRQGYMEREEAA